MREILVAAVAALTLAGCASRLSRDLGAAEDPCHETDFAKKAALATCLELHERPVWAKDEPQTLDLYDRFAAARDRLAKERDGGAISEKQYEQQLADVAADLRGQIAARRAAEAKP
jgi:hypothetical protein